MADFFAVQSGSSATGYLVANGNVYPATSGHTNLYSIPAGNYKYGGPDALAKNQYGSMTDGSDPSKFRKFHIWGTGPGTPIYDKRLKRNRVGIEFHYDGGRTWGTAGCIGYQDPAAKNALIADPNKNVHVEYLQDDAAVKAAIEKKLGHKVDWSKVKAPHKPGAKGGGAAPQSNTRRGKRVKRGQRNVVAGKRRRHTAHVTAPLQGGGKVTHGSRGIFVGRQRWRVSGVDHMTTDGSPLAIGEPTILFT